MAFCLQTETHPYRNRRGEKTKRIFILCILTASYALTLRAQEFPRTCTYDGRTLSETKQQAATGNPEITVLLKDLLKEADKRMKDKIWTITDKTVVAPSGDKHDYVSLATYYWPNPDTTNGLPYVPRDGEKNPENKDYDDVVLNRMINTVQTLSLAYYFTAEEKYAERAVQQIRAWFLDEQTRMNPHMKHAQLKKGLNDGSPIGIIGTRDLTRVIDGVLLLNGAAEWTVDDEKQLKKWFSDYLVWLTESDFGRREANATNNHGTWYDVQAASIALFTGNSALAHEICENAKTNRIARQIEPDGQQPHELKRTLSLTYTFFNLEAFFRLARIGKLAGVDLWIYSTPDGRSIRKALDWTIPYATGQKKWEHKQIKDSGSRVLATLLRQAVVVYSEPSYEKLINEIPGTAAEAKRIALLYPPAR